MRNIWNTKKGYTRGLISAPVKLQSEGVKRLIEDALWTQGLRKKLNLVKNAMNSKQITALENGLKQGANWQV